MWAQFLQKPSPFSLPLQPLSDSKRCLHGTTHADPSLAGLDRRRLEAAGDDPCGVDAIVAACNKAFGVTTCRCAQHSDGGCGPSSPSSSAHPENTAADGLDNVAVDEVENAGTILEADGESNPRSSAGSSSRLHATSSPSSTELTTGVGVDGRAFEETEQSVTTELEISFITDVEVSGVGCWAYWPFI